MVRASKRGSPDLPSPIIGQRLNGGLRLRIECGLAGASLPPGRQSARGLDGVACQAWKAAVRCSDIVDWNDADCFSVFIDTWIVQLRPVRSVTVTLKRNQPGHLRW